MCPTCNAEMNGGLILCGNCWGKLPNDIKSKLIWTNPDVAKTRKTPVKAGAYDELLKTAVGYLRNAEVSDRHAHGNENTTGANGGSLH